jgi:hypothetical protein
MDKAERTRSRKNVWYAFASVAAVLLLALLPAYCRRELEPEAHYADAAAAHRSADAAEWIPELMPAAASDVYERHGRYRRFVRFTVDSAGAAALTGALVRLDTAAARRVPVPVSGWTSWWPIVPQTLQSGQGKQVQVYRVERPPRDRGYLVFDPRTLTAYYWSADR